MLKAVMRGPAMTMRALFFAPFVVAVLSAAGPDKGSFTSGVWHGKANYDGDGKFSDCTMTAQSKSGVLLGFVISKDFDWGLVLADERRGFEVGTAVAVVLLIDARKPIRAIAKVMDATGILIPLESTNPVLDALRHGKVLTIVAGGTKFSFKLTGTRDAIAALAAFGGPARRSGKGQWLHAAPGRGEARA